MHLDHILQQQVTCPTSMISKWLKRQRIANQWPCPRITNCVEDSYLINSGDVCFGRLLNSERFGVFLTQTQWEYVLDIYHHQLTAIFNQEVATKKRISLIPRQCLALGWELLTGCWESGCWESGFFHWWIWLMHLRGGKLNMVKLYEIMLHCQVCNWNRRHGSDDC